MILLQQPFFFWLILNSFVNEGFTCSLHHFRVHFGSYKKDTAVHLSKLAIMTEPKTYMPMHVSPQQSMKHNMKTSQKDSLEKVLDGVFPPRSAASVPAHRAEPLAVMALASGTEGTRSWRGMGERRW